MTTFTTEDRISAQDLILDEPLRNNVIFTIDRPDGGWRRVFPRSYIEEIKPIAETLALCERRPASEYEAYLQEADAVYRNSKANPSWIQEKQNLENDPVVSDLWSQIKMILKLKKANT